MLTVEVEQDDFIILYLASVKFKSCGSFMGESDPEFLFDPYRHIDMRYESFLLLYPCVPLLSLSNDLSVADLRSLDRKNDFP
jgi:hypothetical protein